MPMSKIRFFNLQHPSQSSFLHPHQGLLLPRSLLCWPPPSSFDNNCHFVIIGLQKFGGTSILVEIYKPTPLTGTRNRFAPCINSSLLFILVSWSRWEILTPSSAFLLWALEKNFTRSILKWEYIGTAITPPCFSTICFQRGVLPLLFSNGSEYL